MARTFTGKDVHNWKVCDHSGKPFKYSATHLSKEKRNKPMTDFDGYLTASIAAARVGGVAVRV